MADYESMFMESMGKPIIYNGNTLHMKDDFPLEDKTVFKVIFEQTHSEWRQGIGLRCEKGIKINGKDFGKQIILWEDTAPKIVEIEVPPQTSAVEVKNVWDTGDGVIQSWHNGAAMIIESLSSGRRYKCNDGHPNDDFSDIVFRVEI